jgi:hypothetical protein
VYLLSGLCLVCVYLLFGLYLVFLFFGSAPTKAVMSLTTLPAELIQAIAKRLNGVDAARLAACSRELHAAVMIDSVWLHLHQKR